MAQTKILVDSNSYFRLAQNIHPLLCVPFGKKNVTLYVHSELNKEFRSNSRLQNKFHWVSDSEYVNNRTRSISLSNQQKQDIEDTFDYMWQYAKEAFHQTRGKGPAPVDTRILATALVLGIQVVTDDQDMIELAEEYGVKQLTSLALMKLMLDEGRVKLADIQCVVAQWQYDNDTPYKNWNSEYEELFKSKPPTH